MMTKPTVVIFFNDWKVFPNGVNAGGGESATMALARAIALRGHRVIACANLPEGECAKDGIEFWNFGASYALQTMERRLRDIGPYYCLCATLVHPLLLLREHNHCLARIVINHAPSPHASGIEPSTVFEIIDAMACVSYAQRNFMNHNLKDPEKLVVIRNGFDPDVFQYAGPEHRDWNHLVFIGRIEPPKGIHVLVQVFGELKGEFPHLRLSVFGDEKYWPDFVAQKYDLMQRFPGLEFRGKVPQRELAAVLRSAGLLVFPSISFESAGLAIVDAQASGCPVVGFGVGGVPEYLIDEKLGKVVYDRSPEALRGALAELLRDRTRLIEMSRQAAVLGRQRPWSIVAAEVISLAERVARERLGSAEELLPQSVQRIAMVSGVPESVLLEDHEQIASTRILSDTDLEQVLRQNIDDSWPLLIKGIRLERSGRIEGAMDAYQAAATRSSGEDWQPFFRLALLHAERSDVTAACSYAREVLRRAPRFPLRAQLEQLISMSEGR